MKLPGILMSALFRRSRMERDLTEELRFHIDSRSEDLMRSGLTREDAERRARIEFGAVEAYKDRCRDASGVRWFDELRADSRYTMRTLWASPAFALASILSLAVGIGVNISAFLSVNAMVLQPFPFPHLDRIMTVWQSTKARTQRGRVAAGDFLDFEQHSGSFEQLSAYRPWDVMLTGISDPERVQGAQVTAGFFDTLGMLPTMGRGFTSRECEPGFDAVAVVSHAFWKNRMGSASLAIGTNVSLGGRSFTVIGVMPDEFDFPLATELWAPLALTPEAKQQRATGDLSVLGRLKAGASPAQARAEMGSLAGTLEHLYPQTNEGRGVAIRPLREITNEITDRFVLILLGAATFVLLLACANVGNLQLVRSTARQKEIGIRLALGASRYRVIRQLLTESVVMAAFAGFLGLLLANWYSVVTKAMVPAQVFQWVAGLRTMHIDAKVALFGFALSILVGIGCSLPSIYHLMRERKGAGLNLALKEGGRSSSAGLAGSKARNALVIVEIALALVLLVCAGLMVRTFQRMLTLDAGFDPKNLLTMEVTLSPASYRTGVQIVQFYQRALRGLETISGVEAAGASGWVGTATKFSIERRGELRPDEPRPRILTITPQYFQAMRISILQGRSIGEQDSQNAPGAAVISESVGRHYWANTSPIGEKIHFGSAQSFTVVGVCSDVKDWFGGDAQPQAYLSYQQLPAASMRFVLRTQRDPMQTANSARAEVRIVDSNQPVYNVKSMDQVLSEETSGVRSSANIMSTYAAISLLLAVMGSYSVGAFFVVQRTQEIGVRVALGATRGDIIRMVLKQTTSISIIGLAVGLVLALLMTQIMSHMLYNVVAIEPMTFVSLTVLLATSAVVAAYIPARRAARVDPVIALRNE
jgi:putative ABC transport system permease protein